MVARSSRERVKAGSALEENSPMTSTPAVPGDAPRRFLILHGWQNDRPVGHWQRWLAERLAERGHQVIYPQLPNPGRPVLKEWLEVIEAGLERGPQAERVVVAHSLSCAAWINLAEMGGAGLPVDRLALIAPPGPKFLAETPELQDFQFADGAHEAVRATSTAAPRLVCAMDDPYCDPPANVLYGDTFDVDVIAGAGHLDMVAGYGRWRSALRWCEDGTQRFMAD
jgi:predicted alpha/beta hydrolase family esterase